MGLAVSQGEHPVFSCSAGENSVEAQHRPVDLVHLARQTGGDRLLEEEVLQLFLRQAGKIVREMQSGTDAANVKLAAHTLRGAAEAVGAFDVSTSASMLEEKPSEQKRITALVNEVTTACDYISSILR